MSLSELLLAAAFFPIMAICVLALFFVTQPLAHICPQRFRASLEGATVVLGVVLAIAATQWLNCALFIKLPFADQSCKMLGF